MRKFILTCLMSAALCTVSCGKNQSEQILESLQAVETAMRVNVDNPDALIADLDSCIAQYSPVWEKSAHELESRTKDNFRKEMNLQIAKLRAVSQEIVDLDLEIQDRYRDNPEVLNAYQMRIRKIGSR